jgi:putative membrane protein
MAYSRRCTIVGLAALLVASCAQTPKQASPPPRAGRPKARARPAAPSSLSAAQFVAQAGSIDLFIINSAKLALRRSSNEKIREFATMMVEAHQGTSAQLSLESRRLDVLPSATLLPRHSSMLSALQAAPDFDNVYRQQQSSIHLEAQQLYSSYAAHGASPTLRPVAARALPIVERHIRLLHYL